MRRFFRGIVKCNAGSKPPWRTPDHPPYSEMVEIALRALSEEGGSTESSISDYIQSTFTDLPWGHDRLLPYYLGKLVISGEISSPSHDRYQLSLHHHNLLSSVHSLVSRRGRPLYRQNHSPYSSFKSPSSAPSRRRGRSLVSRFRGRRPENFTEGAPLLHLEHGSVPLRPRRGRPPLQRGGTVGGEIRRSVPRTRRPRGSRVRQDGARGRKLLNNRGWESNALDNPDCLELIHAQSSLEKVESLLLPGPKFSAPELPDLGDGRPFPNAGACQCSSEIPAFRNDKNDAGSEICALGDPEQPMHGEEGEGHPLVTSPQPEHRECQPFAASLLYEHGELQFSAVREVPLPTLEPGKVSYCPSPEHSEHVEGKSSEGEGRPSQVLEQAEPSHEPTLPGERSAVLSPEKLENDDHGPEMPESDDHGPEMPENDDHGPEMPENDDHGPEMPVMDDHGPEMPENDDHGPEMPEKDSHGPEIPENDGHGPEMPENDGHGPEMSENDVHGLEIPENDDNCPEKLENDEHGHKKLENVDNGPEKPENDGRESEMPENDDHGPEKPEEVHDEYSPGKRTALVALDQDVLVGSSGASTKKKRSLGKRRRLKLWFEG